MLKSVATVFAGTALAQLIALALLPVLARLYTPADFGVFQIYASVLRVLLMASAFRYEVGLLETREEGAFLSLLRATLSLSVVTSIAAGLALLWVGESLGLPAVLVWMFPLLLIVASFQQSATFVPIRDQNYKLSAGNKVMQAVLYGAAAIGLAFTPASAIAMPVADGLSRLGAAAGIAGRTRGLAGKILSKFDFPGQVSALRQFIRYPLYTFPGTTMSALSGLVMSLAFVRLYGLETGGQFALMMQVLFAPIGAAAFSVSQVFTGDIARIIAEKPGEAQAVYRKLVRLMVMIALPGAMFGYFAAPWLIVQAFGAQWEMAGRFCALAMPFAFASFVVAPVNMVLIIARKNRWQLAWEMARFAIAAAIYAALAFGQDLTAEFAMVLFSTAFAGIYLAYLVIADRALARLAREV